VYSGRDRLVVTWLVDGGLRIGELCGLHLIDLHLREGAACGQCRTPHVHVCHRPNNPNGAEAKTKHPWRIEDGIVTGGLVKRVSLASSRQPGRAGRYPVARLSLGMLPALVNSDRLERRLPGFAKSSGAAPRTRCKTRSLCGIGIGVGTRPRGAAAVTQVTHQRLVKPADVPDLTPWPAHCDAQRAPTRPD
jgi:hypothetical protein